MMDGSEAYARGADWHGVERAPLSFLFLQGPISRFFDRLGRALIARGHRVHRINLHFGDQLFWQLPATHYRGRFNRWRDFIGGELDRCRVTHLVLHGDRRPYHLVAAEEARARGIPVIATDLGYVRPDWITLEFDGMTTYSRFPRDPAAIRELAARFPEPDIGPRFYTPFWMIAGLDIAYNLGLVFGRLCYPGYRYHSTCHPFAEYAGWLWSRPKKLLTAGAAAAAKRRLIAAPGSYFLVPLQLATDFQIRAHSPFRDERDAVRRIVSSFAAGRSGRKLVFVVHPLDNGLIDWSRIIARLAREHGIADRVMTLHGGTPTELLRNAAGVVTINSTIGVTALYHGVPVKPLGNAVFDIAGLTSQAPLDAFWQAPPKPDPQLMTAFARALVGTTQVKGGYYERRSQDWAIAGFVERFERGLYPLPPLGAADLAARVPRAGERHVVVTGVSDGLGVALARAFAAPGIGLRLLGAARDVLDAAAEDCRQRGALVATTWLPDAEPAALADRLAALDRAVAIDALILRDPVGSNAIEAEAAAVVEAMRRRGGGDIVLVGDFARRGGPVAARAPRALLAQSAALRRRLRRQGVTVAAVTPHPLAVAAAVRLREPLLAAVGDDRIAELATRALRRRSGAITTPSTAVLAWRVTRLLTKRLRLWAVSRAVPRVETLAEPVDEVALPDKTGVAD